MWSRKLCKGVKPFYSISRYQSNQLKTNPEISDLNKFVVGQTVHGFEVQELKNVDDFKLTALSLVHATTKSQYLHLFRNDSNNAFSINFRTTPLNSTGLPHILEHLVLCGSELYPVRDPFFNMLNRSLATFMNAMTGSDYTLYPFSTQNYKDYQNLQKIYLDAVFRPQIALLDFMEEGWRLENIDVDNIESPLKLTGVVYNEMKGAFSENERILMQKIQNLILPDHTYGVVSGGDPLQIPYLTWKNLKEFHSNHYHPSNARFYSYGNFPLLPTLKYLNEEYLSKYSYLSSNHTVVPNQKRWGRPRHEQIYGRYETLGDEFEKQNFVTISLAMCDISDLYETFLLQFISDLLIKGSNAPFYKTMIEPNFSGGFSQCTGFDNQTKDTVFSIGLQGLKKTDFTRFSKLFDYTIKSVLEKGFTEKHIESVLHTYELSLKHETSNFGLNLLFGLTPLWNHDGRVIDALQVNSFIEKLRTNMANDPTYLQQTVKKYFKNNNHRLTLTMLPDKEYENKFNEEEKQLTEKKSAALTVEEKKDLFLKNNELRARQFKPQDKERLPTLLMNDVSDEVERIPVENVRVNQVPVQINTVNSNGIIYFKGVLNTAHLTFDQQMLLPLFCYVANKLGTQKLTYDQFDSLAHRKTAGLNFNVHVGESLYNLHSYEPGISISSYCLEKNVEDMWELWSQLFNGTSFEDVRRFQMLVNLYMTNLTQGLADEGHVYAMLSAASIVSSTSAHKEYLVGLQQIAYMKKLLKTANYPAILRSLSNMAKEIFKKKYLRCALNISEEQQEKTLDSFKQFADQIPPGPEAPVPYSFLTGKTLPNKDGVLCHHYVLNVPMNYCSKAVLTVPYNDPDHAKLRTLSRLLSLKYLHPNLRERHGAYGGGAKLSLDGVFSFYSYRDPRNLQTLDIFDQTDEWLDKELSKVSDQEIVEAKLGVFQGIDAPVPPSQKGCNEFYLRLTPDVLQAHRSEVMSVNLNGLKDVGEKYLWKCEKNLCGKVIIGPKTDCDTTGRKDEKWNVLENVQ